LGGKQRRKVQQTIGMISRYKRIIARFRGGVNGYSEAKTLSLCLSRLSLVHLEHPTFDKALGRCYNLSGLL
jgi:hypothetical protein